MFARACGCVCVCGDVGACVGRIWGGCCTCLFLYLSVFMCVYLSGVTAFLSGTAMYFQVSVGKGGRWGGGGGFPNKKK